MKKPYAFFDAKTEVVHAFVKAINEVLGFKYIQSLEEDIKIAEKSMTEAQKLAYERLLSKELTDTDAPVHVSPEYSIMPNKLEGVFEYCRLPTTQAEVYRLAKMIKNPNNNGVRLLFELLIEGGEHAHSNVEAKRFSDWLVKRSAEVSQYIKRLKTYKEIIQTYDVSFILPEWDEVVRKLNYDAYYMYSDDSAVWRAGVEAQKRHIELLNEYRASATGDFLRFLDLCYPKK